ncbi:MAG: branched-chain amino acid ABC transporter substrate-binding protein [Alphaproteobacteria bacterium]|nr:branched-chain amino acid ABC transporter substrate-binding protein [Alphaproteobacteria bacterium]
MFPSSAEIKFGVVGPMTGPYTTFADQMKAGARQAVEDINANGGIKGEKLSIILGDDACDPKQAVAVANEMVSRGVAFVIGHFCSGSSIPASSTYAEERIIQISPGTTSPEYTDFRPGDGIYRICGRDDLQGAILGKFISEKFHNKRIAIIHDKTSYGKGLADVTKHHLNKLGKQEVIYETYNAGEKDYTALISKLKYANVDVLFIGGYHTEIALIARQMRDQGFKARLIAGDAIISKHFWAIAGNAAEGTLMTFLADPRKNADALPIVERFSKKGIDPQGFTLYVYAAIQVWAQAARLAGSKDYEKVNPILKSSSFNTVLGKISFNKKGDLKNPKYYIYEWNDGKYEYYIP